MKITAIIIFFSVLLVLMITVNIYVPRRLAKYFNLKSSKYIHLFVGIATALIFSMPFLVHSSNPIFAILYLISVITAGIMLLLITYMIDFEIINLFVKLPSRLIGILIILLTIITSLVGLMNGYNFKVSKITIPIKNLSKELSIVHISDVHLGNARGANYLKRIVDKTNKLKPDMIFITGDILDGRSAIKDEIFAVFREFSSPCYAIEGNHDVDVGVGKIIDLLKKNNIIVLQNEIIETNGIQLIGLNHLPADENTRERFHKSDSTIKGIIPTIDIDNNIPSIVLHHSPDGIEYFNKVGIDLILAGHTHAGQIYPINLLAKLLYTYNKGLYNYEGTKIYVSQGVGTFGPPFRVGTSNEITLIKLVAE